MDYNIDFSTITGLFDQARDEGRSQLYEHEVYKLLASSGAETPPGSLLIKKGTRITQEHLTQFSGERIVIKIVSPTIVHKTEVRGVRIIENKLEKINSAVRRMLHEVPETYTTLLERNPAAEPVQYQNLSGTALTEAIASDIIGILLVQYMAPDSIAFGNELIVGLRCTREFGMVLTAGLGGTDTELYAERFRKGQALVLGSTALHTGHSFFELFRKTIAYEKLAGISRGQERIVSDEQLVECFDSFINLGNHYSPLNRTSGYVIEELEINPFAFSDYLMVPLDGVCRFSDPKEDLWIRPVGLIDALLHPRSIGILGVSSRKTNYGRIILNNILAEGYAPEDIRVIHETADQIAGLSCVPGLHALQEPVDLLIVAVGSEQVPQLVDQIVRMNCARSVMLISGGLGETEESEERAEQVKTLLKNNHLKSTEGPVILGANCMGVISKPGHYDTWFIPDEKLAKERNDLYHRSALISQSGAFMLHRTHQNPDLRPAYLISMGNQTDLSLGDMLHHFKDADGVDVIGVYAEGFNDLDGLQCCMAVREAVLNGKEVIIYKAGRTDEGKHATSGHTASIAGDYVVCENCITQAGAMFARTFTEFQELFSVAQQLSTCFISGNRLAMISGAGFEAVGMADSIESDDYQSRLATFSTATEEKIGVVLQDKKLEKLVTIKNPMDINPAADDETHGNIARIVLEDPGVDALVLSLDPLSPAMLTLHPDDSPRYDMDQKGGIRSRISQIALDSAKPVVTVVDGGRLFDPLRAALTARNIPVFNVCDHAVAVLSLYIRGRLASEVIRSEARSCS
ncbi:MAG: CoA-binding protein [Desulfobulbaceae bacterium]|nr:MAG: CoA-binding protein [Desulfobulbaceae bacterium]